MDRQPIRDRTLILRILVPGLETRLRDKMKEVEEEAAERIAAGGNSSSGGGKESATILDLEGVACEPTKDANTLFNFICDGRTYPARLVNLPCPIELHKTHDHAMYYKSCDVAQMLIVYEDSMALDEADAYPKTEAFPSYYHSGLTPPMRRVVEKRFKKTEHAVVPPPRVEVNDAETELLELMYKISKEGPKRNKVPSLTSAQHANKVLEEVVDEIVQYEEWMDDYGRQPSGVEFDANDTEAIRHPELWLSPEKIEEIDQQERVRQEEETRKKEAAQAKKEKKKKKKKDKENPTPSKKKGIASRKNEPPVDNLDQIAINLMTTDDNLVGDDLDFEDLNFDMNELELDLPPGA
eukprot:scaffold22609_cov142-Cylindrotheca_fusiformis.AAC.4